MYNETNKGFINNRMSGLTNFMVILLALNQIIRSYKAIHNHEDKFQFVNIDGKKYVIPIIKMKFWTNIINSKNRIQINVFKDLYNTYKGSIRDKSLSMDITLRDAQYLVIAVTVLDEILNYIPEIDYKGTNEYKEISNVLSGLDQVVCNQPK